MRFGSKADMTPQFRDVRFTPNSGHQTVALGIANKYSNSPHLIGLLRSRSEWPGGDCAAKSCKKFPPPHARLQAQNAASYRLKAGLWKGPSLLQNEMLADVRFGSKADMPASARDVRFTPESGHWWAGSGVR